VDECEKDKVMAQHSENKYSVNSKLAALQTRVTELESANKALRVTLLAELQTYLDVHCHGMNGVDGKNGMNGVDGQSITGPQGPAGDITTYGPEELQQAVIALRIKLKTLHATYLAHLIEGIEGHKKGSVTGRIVAGHLETILKEISKLQ
jgi:hypothetical protein